MTTILAVILLFIWPMVFSGIVAFGEWLVGFGSFGAFLYGVFNRLLIPTGLHHALNAVFCSIQQELMILVNSKQV